MFYRNLVALALWSLLVAAACVPAKGLAAAEVDANTAQRLQAIIDHSRDDGLPGGIIVRIESLKEGRVWTGTSGPFDEATAQPIKPNDAFRVASITKSFSAAVIWRLVEEGKISVDDAIAKYLPADLVRRIHVLNGVSYGDRITIRQLLCHCAGLYDYATDKDVLRYTFAHPKKHWTPMELVETALRSGSPYFPPGQGQHYSDTGYLLLGMIIEKVTGKPLARVYHEFIYSPLGMHDIYLEAREPAVGPPLSHNYVGYLDEHDFDPTLDAYASGGQVSTAAELARFIAAVMQGHFFKDPGTLAAALAKPELPDNPSLDEERYLGRYLFYSTERDGVALIGHAGFWGGAMFYDAQRDIVITGTSNQVDRRVPLAELLKAFESGSVSR
jgi:D-alanyl-D-alanine carboxypeptidase